MCEDYHGIRNGIVHNARPPFRSNYAEDCSPLCATLPCSKGAIQTRDLRPITHRLS